MIENGGLLEAFRHNSWATKQLLSACRNLTDEQLASAATGTYGDILDTLNHIVRSEGGYGRRLAGAGPDWVGTEDVVGVGQLEARVEDLERLWAQLLSEPFDADKLFLLDEGNYEAHAGVILVQALHHGNAHREQVCSILTAIGVEPPDIQSWTYGEATGRSRELR